MGSKRNRKALLTSRSKIRREIKKRSMKRRREIKELLVITTVTDNPVDQSEIESN